MRWDQYFLRKDCRSPGPGRWIGRCGPFQNRSRSYLLRGECGTDGKLRSQPVAGETKAAPSTARIAGWQAGWLHPREFIRSKWTNSVANSRVGLQTAATVRAALLDSRPAAARRKEPWAGV